MKPVSIVGIGQLPIAKNHSLSVRELGASAAHKAMEDAGVERVDALYASNMLSDELQGQKHVAALIADEIGLEGVEALQIRAATAAGAAALRVAYLAVASGTVELALAVGVEKMSSGIATPAMAKALDAESEVPVGATLLSQNARLMQLYFDRFNPPREGLAHFSVNAHRNASNNPLALFQDRQFTVDDVLVSRLVTPPLRLLDCSPICDGAAAVVLAPAESAHRFSGHPVRILSSSASTDRFRVHDRVDPLNLMGARNSSKRAFEDAGITPADVSLFELHDAFSIMACLSLEAAGFAAPGEGWRLAAEGEITIGGRIPISTMGGLKARGHPIGGTALYQTCEIVLQLTGQAGANQVPSAEIAMTQSIGGAASTIITHIFGA